MRCLHAVVIFGAAAVSGADQHVTSLRFGKEDAGRAPTGWKTDKTGTGEGSVWQVVEDETAPSRTGYVIAQMAESPGSVFNLCVAQSTDFRDGEISVFFKAVRGKKDQGGGIVWRYRDHDNYYIARMNPLEDNYRVYKVVRGRRIQLATREGLTVKPGEWHKLKITMVGDHIQCFLDGKKLLDAKDATFPAAGKVGLWSKADAQTYFDDLSIRQ